MLIYQRKLDSLPRLVHLQHGYLNVLMQLYHAVHIADESGCEFGDVHQATFFDPDIDEAAEIGDVVHDSGQFHSCGKVADALHPGIKFKDPG